MATNAIRAARQARGWSQAEAARALAHAAERRGEAAATAASLKTLLSRWENGHSVPEPSYRDLLAHLYGCAVTDLGLAPSEPAPDPAARLRAGVGTAVAVDPAVLHGWIGQLALAHGLDARLGPSGAAAAVEELLRQVERAHTYGCRQPGLGALRAEVLLLAGVHALDAADPDTAYTRFGRARDIASSLPGREAATVSAPGPADGSGGPAPRGSPGAGDGAPPPAGPSEPPQVDLGAHRSADADLLAVRAAAGQSRALLDAGAPRLAIAVLAEAARGRRAAGPDAGAVLAAAQALAHAAAGEPRAARSALERARVAMSGSDHPGAGPPRGGGPGSAGAVPTAGAPMPPAPRGTAAPMVDAAVPPLPVEVEVTSGAGHALAVLRDPAAQAPLTAVLRATTRLRLRAEAHADLAVLRHALGRADDAARHAREARHLAERGGLRRVLHRLAAVAG